MASVPRSLGRHIPAPLAWGGAVLFVAGLFTANPALTAGSIAVILAIYALTWRRAEPPILFYALAYQWLQAVILVFHADVLGIGIGEMDLRALSLQARPTDVDLETATWLTLAGLVAIAAGMRLAAGAPAGAARLAATAATARISVHRAFAACLLSMAASSVLGSVAYMAGGLAQLVLALANVHWVFVFIYTYAVLSQRRGWGGLALVFAIELGVGFVGYFSEFKTVLVVMLLAALAVPSALKGGRLWAAGVLVVLMVILGTVWSAIKVEYRDFVNDGTGHQVVAVSRTEQVEALAHLVGNLDAEDLGRGAANLVNRLSYVYFLGEMLERVPHYLPHENGALWAEAVYRALVPRLFDPDKAATDDSARTEEYTGLQVIGSERGTSVSLGYMAESYIDFGAFFMMAPLFAWGLLVGHAYRTLAAGRVDPLFGYGAATVLVMVSSTVLEMSNAKMIAALLVNWLVLYLVYRYAAAEILARLRLPSTRGAFAQPAGAPK